jgi:hypothetical protein
MMKPLAATAAALLLAACSTADARVEVERFGEPLSLSEATPVATILDDPDAWVGERVLVEGMVVGVCDKRGCWMEIAAEEGDRAIRVKVEDGVMVFPLTARGQTARAEGIVEKVELTHEEALEQARHRAEEHDEVFDPASITGPVTHYRIRGLGAEISG